jgi:hypothetical protein
MWRKHPFDFAQGRLSPALAFTLQGHNHPQRQIQAGDRQLSQEEVKPAIEQFGTRRFGSPRFSVTAEAPIRHPDEGVRACMFTESLSPSRLRAKPQLRKISR